MFSSTRIGKVTIVSPSAILPISFGRDTDYPEFRIWDSKQQEPKLALQPSKNSGPNASQHTLRNRRQLHERCPLVNRADLRVPKKLFDGRIFYESQPAQHLHGQARYALGDLRRKVLRRRRLLAERAPLPTPQGLPPHLLPLRKARCPLVRLPHLRSDRRGAQIVSTRPSCLQGAYRAFAAIGGPR